MWCTPLAPALERQKQKDLCELKNNLAHTVHKVGKGYVMRPRLKKSKINKSW